MRLQKYLRSQKLRNVKTYSQPKFIGEYRRSAASGEVTRLHLAPLASYDDRVAEGTRRLCDRAADEPASFSVVWASIGFTYVLTFFFFRDFLSAPPTMRRSIELPSGEANIMDVRAAYGLFLLIPCIALASTSHRWSWGSAVPRWFCLQFS